MNTGVQTTRRTFLCYLWTVPRHFDYSSPAVSRRRVRRSPLSFTSDDFSFFLSLGLVLLGVKFAVTYTHTHPSRTRLGNASKLKPNIHTESNLHPQVTLNDEQLPLNNAPGIAASTLMKRRSGQQKPTRVTLLVALV